MKKCHNPSEPWLSVSKRARAPLRIHSSQRHTFTYSMEELTGTLLYKYVEVATAASRPNKFYPEIHEV